MIIWMAFDLTIIPLSSVLLSVFNVDNRSSVLCLLLSVFNVGNYRRQAVGAKQPSDFFDPQNKDAMQLRRWVTQRGYVRRWNRLWPVTYICTCIILYGWCGVGSFCIAEVHKCNALSVCTSNTCTYYTYLHMYVCMYWMCTLIVYLCMYVRNILMPWMYICASWIFTAYFSVLLLSEVWCGVWWHTVYVRM